MHRHKTNKQTNKQILIDSIIFKHLEICLIKHLTFNPSYIHTLIIQRAHFPNPEVIHNLLHELVTIKRAWLYYVIS